MSLFSRASESTGVAEAVYARILDGEHLWLAVRGDGPLSLRGDGVDVEVPVQVRDGLLTAVFSLREVTVGLGDDARLTLVAGSGRKAAPVLHAAPGGDPSATHDGRADVLVEAVDGVVVVRRVLVQGIEASGFVSTGAGVEVVLGPAQESLPETESSVSSVSLVVKDRVLAELPVVGGRLLLTTLPALPPGTTATLRVAAVPVVRRANVMARPNYAVLLPSMVEADVELRWLKDGRLAVHRSNGGGS